MTVRDALPPTLIGGVVASFAMDAVQEGFAALFERHRPPGDRDEEVEGIASLVRIVGRVVPAVARGGRAHATAHAIHYAFGIAFAGAYVVVAERLPVVATSRGFAFGTVLFLVSDRVLIPTLRLGRAWARYSRLERTNAFLSHVAYGLALDAVRRRALARGVARARAEYDTRMQNEDGASPDGDDRDDVRRTAVTAADDTGMVAQHEIVVVDEPGEPVLTDDADVEERAP